MPILTGYKACNKCGSDMRYVTWNKDGTITLKYCPVCQMVRNNAGRGLTLEEAAELYEPSEGTEVIRFGTDIVPTRKKRPSGFFENPLNRCERCGLLLAYAPDCGSYCGYCLAEVLLDYRPEVDLAPVDWWEDGGGWRWT